MPWTCATGEQLWSLKVEDHAWARITGGSTLFDGRLYVPVSSFEELPGARPDYPCCTFRGSVVAIDATTGKQIWKTYTIPEAPAIVGKNAAGTPLWKPAGAAIWAAPTIDAARRRLYVATGNAYTEPAAPTSDAVMALALDTGAIQWVSQVTPSDAFLVGCRPGNAQLPRRRRARLRLRQLADPAPAGQRTHRDRHRPEVGRGVRARPRQQGRGAVAVPRRPGQRAGRHRVGLGRRRSA